MKVKLRYSPTTRLVWKAQALLDKNMVHEFNKLRLQHPEWTPALVIDDINGVQRYVVEKDEEEWMLFARVVSLPDKSDEGFELAIDGNAVDPIGMVRRTYSDWKDWIFTGPRVVGKRTARFKFLRAQRNCVPYDYTLRAGLAMRGFKLAEGQWREPFLEKFPNCDGKGTISFVGSEWSTPLFWSYGQQERKLAWACLSGERKGCAWESYMGSNTDRLRQPQTPWRLVIEVLEPAKV
jgi:hypothetical protein